MVESPSPPVLETRPLPRSTRHDIAKRPTGPHEPEARGENGLSDVRHGSLSFSEAQGRQSDEQGAMPDNGLENGVSSMRDEFTGQAMGGLAVDPMNNTPPPSIQFGDSVHSDPGSLDFADSPTRSLRTRRDPSEQPNNQPAGEDSNHRLRTSFSSDQTGFDESALLSMRKLYRSRTKVHEAREEVDFARNEAATARKRAFRTQNKLLDAQIAAVEERAILPADRNILQLSRKALAAMKHAKKLEEEVEKLERRLEAHEYRMERREKAVFEKLSSLVSSQAPGIFGNLDDLVADDDDDDDRSSTSSQASSTDHSEPLVRQYHDTVAQISILRERLNEYEISHRERVIAHDEEFEETYAQKREAVNREFLTEDSVEKYLANVFAAHRNLLDSYFQERAALAQDLLDTIEQGKAAQQQCQEQDLDYEDQEDANALADALQYDLDGPVGRMYSVNHEGPHLGVRPLDLVRVPFLHASDRVKHWLLHTASQTRQMSSEEMEQQIHHISKPRIWKVHQALPINLTPSSSFSGSNGRDSAAIKAHASYDEGYGSSKDSLHPSHAVPVQDRGQHQAPRSEIPSFLWTWSGEWADQQRPSSEPDIIKPSDDHFDEWTKPESHTWD